MTHPFGVRGEVTVDAPPEQAWTAITTGPGVDSWLMGRTVIDAAGKTSTFDMLGAVSTSAITAWEPGHAAMYMLIHGYNGMTFATAHYFDDRDRSAETQAWQAWLGTLG